MLSDIITTLHQHWASSTAGTPTLYPGTVLNTDEASAWYELWVNALGDLPHRRAHPETLNVAITIHCFARHSTNTLLAHELAEAAQVALTHQDFPIFHGANANNVVGHLSIREGTLRNLSKVHADRTLPQLQQLVLSFIAQAQRLPNQ
ncbi:MAG: hypothetical protein R3C01_07575 [Planctomycetaceae bacterium]